MKNYKFHLSCDSSVDEVKTNLFNNDISCFPMIYIHDDIEEKGLFDSKEEFNSFYDKLKSGVIYSTAGISEFEAAEYFNELLGKVKTDIVHLTLSSGLSETYNFCKAAAEKINRTSPHKIYVIDSTLATRAGFFLVEIAKNLRNQGKSAEAAAEILEKEKRNIHTYFYVQDLKYLKRGGRISGTAAVVGNLLQLKPIIKIDKQGKLIPVDKIIGTKKANMNLAQRALKYHDFNKYPVYIIYADDLEKAEELIGFIKSDKPEAKINIGNVGPIIGSHTGPGFIACSFYSDTDVKDSI